MSSFIHRALRATVAAAGMAALGIFFVGSAAAATPHSDDSTNASDDTQSSHSHHATSDRKHPLDNQSPTPPSLTNRNDTPGVYNDLVTFEVPKVKTSAYHTSLHGVPVSHHEDVDDSDYDWADDENNGDEDNICHGTGGSQDLPFHNSIQHPCQSHGNSFHEGDVQYPHRQPI